MQRRIEERQERILQALSAKQSEGKTVEEIVVALGHEYSRATIRTDLIMLKERGDISFDDKRKPVIWWRSRQK